MICVELLLVTCYSLMTHRDQELHRWSGVLVDELFKKAREDKCCCILLRFVIYMSINQPSYVLDS